MANQSSRIYFNGKDHKDIYFQGNYHKAMYIGNELVWEKQSRPSSEFKFEIYLSQDNTIDLGSCFGRYVEAGAGDDWHITVDWGDGSVSQVTVGQMSHTYEEGQYFTVTIKGQAVFSPDAYSSSPLYIVSILTKFSKTGVRVWRASDLFRGQGYLKRVPENLFEEFGELTDFIGCFSNCYNLEAIPEGLFASCTSATNFSYCFSNCYNLKVIPGGLFAGCTGPVNFEFCFEECKRLTTISKGLFADSKRMSAFNSCFYNCSSLTTIPEELFAGCIYASSFDNCFNGCSSLTTIPGGLFAGCTYVEYFSSCFSNCTGITTISEGIFEGCTRVIDLSFCFDKSSKLRYAPPFWKDYPRVDSRECFRECTSASNYNEIPDSWK